MSASRGLLLLTVAASSVAAQEPQRRASRPLTTADAVIRIPEVIGAVRVLGDLDGDGYAEIAVDRLSFDARWRIDAVSLADGETLRPLWTAGDLLVEVTAWDAGGDLDGDGTGDLLVGLGTGVGSSRNLGKVIAVSSSSRGVLHEIAGAHPFDGLGTSVVFLDDLDGDGLYDFAAGAPQVDPWREVSRDELEHASTRPGFVSARSGKDGSELWRADGTWRGHAFGAELRRSGDWNRDGHVDLLARCDSSSPEPFVIVSGMDGTTLDRLEHFGGLVEPIGDVDADGSPDLVVEHGTDPKSADLLFVSGATHDVLFRHPPQQGFTNWRFAIGLGDFDADGCDDYAIGIPDWDIGRATVYSGKTGRVRMKCRVGPQAPEGLDRRILAVPDVTGDGHPDLLVGGQESLWLFAGVGGGTK